MKDIEIKISRETSYVDLPKRQAFAVDGENLQGNFIFNFVDEFVNGQARLELTIDGQDSWIPLLKSEETYYCPIKSAITKYGQIEMQLVITENENEEGIPIFKSNTFYLWCERSINAEIEMPDEYPTWIELANEKLNEMDNLDIDAEKIDDTTTITITKKDGSQESVEIKDGNGVGLDYDWEGTSLGVKREDETEYQYTDLKGPKGDPGAVKMQVVETLPATGAEDTIYLVPSSDPATQNIYDEYIYTNGSWEMIGTTNIDLSNYATKDEVNAKYTKPTTGIPSTDLASGVIPDVSGKEDTTNKTTTLSSSSTDTQYPSAKAVYDYGDLVFDLGSYNAGDIISNAADVAKLKDGRTIIYYNGIYYRLAAIYGSGYVYTTMSGTDHGQWITLNYRSDYDDFYFYENDTAYWEVPSHRVQNLSNPTTDTYPSTLAVYNALQGLGGDKSYLGYIDDFDQQHPLDLNSLDKGIYFIRVPHSTSINKYLYLKATVNNTELTTNLRINPSTGSYILYDTLILNVTTKIEDMTFSGTSYNYFGYLNYDCRSTNNDKTISYNSTNIRVSSSDLNATSSSTTSMSPVLSSGAQTISGVKTFNNIPEISSSLTPTTDYQLVNKKYVDDNAGGGGTSPFGPPISWDMMLSTNNPTTTNYPTIFEQIKSAYNYSVDNNLEDSMGIITSGTSNSRSPSRLVGFYTSKKGSKQFYCVFLYTPYQSQSSKIASLSYVNIDLSGATFDSDGKITTMISSFRISPMLFGLATDNQISYTPQLNYNPSTKLYSDTVPLKISGLSIYNATSTYQVGDYVYRSSTDLTIYKCNTANTTGSWSNSKWNSKTYLEYLSDKLVGSALGGSY